MKKINLQESLLRLNYEASLHYLIVEFQEVSDEKVSEGGIIMAETKQEKNREQEGESLAVVLHVGPCCWQGFDDGTEFRHIACDIGDTIVLAQYAGQKLPSYDEMSLEDQDYLSRIRLIKDSDVLARCKTSIMVESVAKSKPKSLKIRSAI